MEENIQEMDKNVQNNEEIEQDTNQIYIDAINKLKKESISKEKYDKILSERDKLVEQMMSGNAESEKAPEEPKRSLSELRKALSSGNLTNKEVMETLLELRDRVAQEEGKDILVAQSAHYTPTRDSYDASEQFVQVMKESLEDCQGDSESFINGYMRRTNDVQVPIKRR